MTVNINDENMRIIKALRECGIELPENPRRIVLTLTVSAPPKIEAEYLHKGKPE